MFDYFLSTLGEVSLEEVGDLVRQHVQGQISGEAATLVMSLFRQHLVYLERAEAASGEGPPGAPPLVYFDKLVAIREEVFGPELSARLFADEDAATRLILEHHRLAARDALPETKRQEELETLEASLPPAIRDARARMRAPATARQQVAAARRAGGSDQEVWDIRATHLGPAAADRLAELDRDRVRRNFVE